jgi:mRNA-degrading endonuclease RelE of RelBE toxin-antitoxin system
VEILVSADAHAKFDRLPRTVKARVARIYERLLKWPEVSGAKPLRHGLKGHYRIRTGDWRIVFTVQGDTLRIVDIDHRKDVYKD